LVAAVPIGLNGLHYPLYQSISYFEGPCHALLHHSSPVVSSVFCMVCSILVRLGNNLYLLSLRVPWKVVSYPHSLASLRDPGVGSRHFLHKSEKHKELWK
jgi:hypothetical protein